MNRRHNENNRAFWRRLAGSMAFLVMLCGAGLAVAAQNSSEQEKVRNIRQLLVLTNAGDFGAQIIEQSLAQIKLNLSQAPAGTATKVLGEFERELRQEFSAAKMIEAIIPIYDKYLTNRDVINLTVFYQTPTGRKLIAALPQISKETIEEGVRRGRDVNGRVLARLQAEGVLKAAPTPVPPTVKKQRPRRAT